MSLIFQPKHITDDCHHFLVICFWCHFRSTNTMFMGDFKTTDSCNNNCHCAMSDYNPVCGTNDIMYYSPCFAGCQNLVTSAEDSQVTGPIMA